MGSLKLPFTEKYQHLMAFVRPWRLDKGKLADFILILGAILGPNPVKMTSKTYMKINVGKVLKINAKMLLKVCPNQCKQQ